MKTCVFTLLPVESKRLLGRAVAQMACVQRAYQHGRLIVAGGTTNAYVLEELTGEPVAKGSYTAGVITEGVACVTDATTRQAPAVFVNGARVERPWLEVLQEFTADDVFVKGANAIDLAGNAGVLVGAANGGTIGQAMGYLAASGARLIMPVGLEKLVPDVGQAAAVMGQKQIDQHWGMACGLYVVTTGQIITEIEALAGLFCVEATAVAAGGVAGTEGAITLAVQGNEEAITAVTELVCELKEEQPFTVEKRNCQECSNPCAR